MAPLKRAILTVEADVNGDGAAETGEFHMYGDLTITESIRTGFVVDARGGTINSIVSEAAFDGESKRKSFFVELGSGAHAVEVEFQGWIDATDDDGNDVQWGNTGDPSSTTVADATGANPITQINIWNHYLNVAEIDSRNPAQLEYGEHHSGGLLDPLAVVLEQPSLTHDLAEEPNVHTGSVTFISAADFGDVVDAAERRLR